MAARNILLAGETWISHKVDVKGFASYSIGSYGIGCAELVAVLREHGHTVTHLPNHDVTDGFPWDQEAMSEYDVVILSDVAADTIQIHPDCFDLGRRTPDRLRVLGDHVAGGAGLLMVGGYMSFSGIEGKAHYQSTPLAEVLPVTMLGHDDRVETPEGVTPAVAGPHAVLDGIPADWPHFLGYNRLAAKPDATVLMSVGTDPFLTVGGWGRGRVAAFASDCSPHWGSPEFLGWEGYDPFWARLVDWLGGTAD
jgi:uncharacterized membrane protein